jgi:hypothetical protein
MGRRVVWWLAVAGAAGVGLAGWWVWWLPPLLAAAVLVWLIRVRSARG